MCWNESSTLPRDYFGQLLKVKLWQRTLYRHLYEDIVACLKATSNIPGCGEAMYRLVNDLYNRKPALPSLRRELTAAGLTSYIVVRGT